MTGKKGSTEETLNLNLTVSILRNRETQEVHTVARAIVDAESELTRLYLERARQTPAPPPSEKEDLLEELIDSSFEYLCRVIGVPEAEELCKSFER